MGRPAAPTGPWLSANDVAAECLKAGLSVTSATIRRWARIGQIDALRFGGEWRFKRSLVKVFLHQDENKAGRVPLEPGPPKGVEMERRSLALRGEYSMSEKLKSTTEAEREYWQSPLGPSAHRSTIRRLIADVERAQSALVRIDNLTNCEDENISPAKLLSDIGGVCREFRHLFEDRKGTP